MKLPIKTLDIFFRRMEAQPAIAAILERKETPEDGRKRFKKMFMSLAETTLSGYSEDEQENIWSYDHQIFEKYTEKKSIGRAANTGFHSNLDNHASGKYDPPFSLLYDFSKSVLEMQKNRIVCRYDELLNWRDAYLLLGQDIFTTSWLAKQEERFAFSGGSKPMNFSWPAAIPVNHSILEQTLDGLAENHMHFVAGASTFALSWSCMMNHIERVPGFIADLEKRQQPRVTRSLNDESWSLTRYALYAAKIRMVLFAKLHRLNLNRSSIAEMRAFHRGFIGDSYDAKLLARDTEKLRYMYGVRFSQPGSINSEKCLDYAFCYELANEVREHSRILAGERYFLYQCFKYCFKENEDSRNEKDMRFTTDEKWLFYIYLLIKAQMRGEWIQLNHQTGFTNFQVYDSRKYKLWNDLPEYWNEDYRQTLNANICEQKLDSIEARVGPGIKALENIERVHSYDCAKLYYDSDTKDVRDSKRLKEHLELMQWKPGWLMEDKTEDEKHYYVYAFAKKHDELPTGRFSEFHLCCRHNGFRKDIRRKAIEIAKALSNSDYLCGRIYGIDACSVEIGCRPEVFATAFRFLQNFSPESYRLYNHVHRQPCLSVTYHVGEDFLDIADGLRAMDEAVLFLDLRYGSRFGHALALGVDPGQHYKTKHHMVILPKQDMLDNLVWLYYRSIDFNVDMPPNLKERLRSRAKKLFDEIYQTDKYEGSGDRNSMPTCSLEDYYHSMLLRGDDPERYSFDGSYKDYGLHGSFDIFGLNRCEEIQKFLEIYRPQKKLCRLYWRYHYDYDVKKKGAEQCKMQIDSAYVMLMRRMQEAMRKHINAHGICIECNPSSNVLIGTFEHYKHHPLLNFNNEGLNMPQAKTQMHVSVNTDDPGVFDTTLTFEYMLMAKTLAEMKDEKGERIHTDRSIEAYIRNLIRMGREQRFPAAD